MKKLMNIILTLLMLIVLFTLNIFADQNRVLKVEEEVFVLEGSGSFSLENVAGNIEVNSWEKEEVKMIATKSIDVWGTANPEEILDKIDIKIISQPKNLTIYTRYPLSSWPKNTRVDYQLWIPKGVSVKLESVSGTIKMEDHLNRINASTVSGNIKLNNITGNVGLKTVSGKVKASQIKGDIKATSVSGSLIFRECEGIFSDLQFPVQYFGYFT